MDPAHTMPMPSETVSDKFPGKNAEDKNPRTSAIEFPKRYSVREAGSERMLLCIEAPNLAVYIKAGLSVSAAAVNKSAPGTIYLDGVAQTGPLLDNAHQIYNFDHHEGCVRSFTLSTCEQVLLMVKKGLDLRSRDWKIIANDPDLDTVLAIWLLLNHVRINEQKSIREHILFPLVRLEGIIDAVGLEMKALSALPTAMLNQIQRIIDHLRRKELQIKKDGKWEQTDFLKYTAEILHEMDQIIYESRKFGELLGVEELARVNLPDNHVAVVVQSDMGIYEIEPQLKKIYGANLGLAILRRTPKAYTLRKIDPFLTGSLEDVYERLNFMDPAVKCRTQNSQWGGSSDIGGSPRDRGTQLRPEEIAKACGDAFEKPSFFQQMVQFLIISACCTGALAIAELAAAYWQPGKWFNASYLNGLIADPYFGFSVALILLTTIILVGTSNRRFWQFGIISPVGRKWWFILPVTLLAAFTGGAWVPVEKPAMLITVDPRLYFAGMLLLPFAVEFLFRGVLHGILAQKAKIQSCSSKYFISWPNFGTSILYALLLPFFPIFHSGLFNPFATPVKSGVILLAAFCFSLSLGFARERSHSFFTSYLFHLISVSAIVFLPAFLTGFNHLLQRI